MPGTFPLQMLIEFTGMLSHASDSLNLYKRIFSSFHITYQNFNGPKNSVIDAYVSITSTITGSWSE